MSGTPNPSVRNPWTDQCHDEFDSPDWGPLMETVKDADLAGFMWMGRLRGESWSIELYKHRASRRYLNIDQDGNTYQYVDSEYTPISTATALRRVLGRSG